MKKMKLFPKTFLYTMLLLCFMNLIIHLSIYYFYPVFYLNKVEATLDQKIEQLAQTLTEVDSSSTSGFLYTFALENSVNVTITEATGQKKTYQGLPFQILLPYTDDESFSLKGVEDVESLIIRNRTVSMKDRAEAELQIMASTQPVKEAAEIISFLLPYTIGITVICSMVFAYFYSRKITDPVLKMLKVTSDMKNLKQDACFSVPNEDEIGMLANQINQVYEHLWKTIDSLDREKNHISALEKSKVDFLRSASHELKTPLSGLRILLENMRYNIGKYKDHDKYLGTAIESVDQLSAMVKEILDSSRIQTTALESAKDTIAVKEEIGKVLEDYALLAASRSLTVEERVSEAFTLEMNRQLFHRVWSNLISNAVRYSDENGRIVIENKGSKLLIRNTCTPLTQEQISHIFEAFYRPDFSRNSQSGGSGLGLYIVKEILDSNRMECRFEPCEDGMCFWIL